MNMEPTTKPAPPKDVTMEGVIDEARAALPAFVVADTPEGPAVSRSEDPPDNDTVAWLPTEPEDTAAPLSVLTERFGVDKVLMYLEPEPFDLETGEVVDPDETVGYPDNKVDPIVMPVRQTETETASTVPTPAVTASAEPAEPVSDMAAALPWDDGPIAVAINDRTAEAVAVLTGHVETLERIAARIASVDPAALAAPVEVDADLESKLFGDPPATAMNMVTAAVLGNPDAQRALVGKWEDAYLPGMDPAELIAATLPPRPEGGSMAHLESWDAAAHEAAIWVANQAGEPAPAEGDPENPIVDEPGVGDRPEIVDVPLLAETTPTAVTAASSGTSSMVTEAERRQRIDAARISADRRRKAREAKRMRQAMKMKKRANGRMSSDFQEAMSMFQKHGVRGQDVSQDLDGYVAGTDDNAHERVLNSLHDSGYDINTFADGSGWASKGGRAVGINRAPGGSNWSADGIRLSPGQAGGQRLRPPRPDKKKAKKQKKWKSAFGR